MFKKEDTQSRREKIKKAKNSIVAEEDVSEKISSYKTTVTLSGDQLAMMQNILSHFLENDPQGLVTLAPNLQGLVKTLETIQKEIRKMAQDVGLDLSNAKRVSTEEILKRGMK